MKKFFVLFCILILSVGFALADDIGLTVGAEFGIGNITKVDDGDWEPYVMPMIAYDRSFLDGALNLSAELDYTFDFTPKFDDVSHWLYFDLSLGYNLHLGRASTLSFILENELDEFNISPRSSDGNNFTGIFTPGIKFNQNMSIGDIYAKAEAPITYIQDEKDADKTVGLKSTLGWKSTFGLGLWARLYSSLVPNDFYQGIGADISYETGSIYFELFARTNKEMSDGIFLEPWFEYYLGKFTFYAFCDFDGIAADGGGAVTISPALGIKFSF